jgi:hypothetical protein
VCVDCCIPIVKPAIRVSSAREGHRHLAILHEARGLARFVRGGLLTHKDIKDTLLGAGSVVGTQQAEIEAIVDWAVAHPSNAVLPKTVR